ncbi:MAG: phosphatidylglycerophosphatase A [Candidatus Riflebacteria bacterium]|nr:phosphatidylglycerophosphatase A [Candidatus Riflebacteria bacterium]
MTTLNRTETFWQNKSGTENFYRFLGSFGNLGYVKTLHPLHSSLPGILLYFMTRNLHWFLQLSLLVLFILVAVAVSEKLEQIEKTKNPKEVILDDIAGMWISLFAIQNPTWKIILLAFLIYRALDTVKPFPISIFKTFKGGRGMLADDLAAGMLTSLIIRYIIFHEII